MLVVAVVVCVPVAMAAAAGRDLLVPVPEQEVVTGDVIRCDDTLDGNEKAYPPDPTDDIPWTGGTSGVASIQSAFNNGRTVENSQLGSDIPMMTLPSQNQWDGMSDSEKAFWLVNRERLDRDVHAMHGVESNVEGIAQYYAQYLLDNNAWGHNEDGHTPWQRLNTNPAINACHDFLNVAENLAAFMSSMPNIPLPVERSVYNWMYDDAGSSWGHRHMILWYPYNDNSGPAGMEGFMGIGRVFGGPWQGWPYAQIVVMNVFDPCASWDYGDDDLIFEDDFENNNTNAWDLTVP
jgi:hypothetical protein